LLKQKHNIEGRRFYFNIPDVVKYYTQLPSAILYSDVIVKT